jgi:hypothetical protein
MKPDESKLQVAVVVAVGDVMRGREAVLGSALWTETPEKDGHDLPPLRFKETRPLSLPSATSRQKAPVLPDMNAADPARRRNRP